MSVPVFNPFDHSSKDIRNFIEQYVDSFVTWDLIVYFYNHPATALTQDILAEKLGRGASELTVSLQSMSSWGILSVEKGRDGELFKYMPVPEIAAEIEKFIDALETREKRLAILAHVLRREAG